MTPRPQAAPVPVLALALLLAAAPAWGQAEPAPPGSVPGAPPSDPIRPRTPQAPRVRVSAGARLSGLLGETAQVAPALGWGFGLQLSASLLPLGALRLGFVLDFAQDRFSRLFDEPEGAAQLLTHTTFAAQGLLDWPGRWVRPYFAAGIGLSLARHESPFVDPASETGDGVSTAVVPLLRLSAGLGISPLRWFEFGPAVDLSFTFSGRQGGVIDAGGGLLQPATGPIFQPGWWSVGTFVAYRFS